MRIKDNVKDYLPDTYADAKVSVFPFHKIGNTYTALTVKLSDDSATPAVNLDELYKDYMEGLSLDEVGERMSEIAREMLSGMVTERAKYVISSYESIKENLFVRLCNAEENKEFLRTVPHKRIEDLAVTYSINFGGDGNNLLSATITDKIVEKLHIDTEQLHQDAIENSSKMMPARVGKVSSMLGYSDDYSAGDGPYIITNQVGINGASAIMYPGVLDALYEKMGEGFYVCPSSQHELIIVPDSAGSNENLSQIVKNINDAMVPEKDFLSNNVYHYDGKKFELAEKFEQRMQENTEMIFQNDADFGPSYRMRM